MAPRIGQEALVVTGKGSKQRMVPLLPVVTAAIADYLAACPYTHQKDQPLFLAKSGGPLTARRVQQRMQDLRGTPGLPESATQHSLRPSFAPHLPAPKTVLSGYGVAGTV